MKSDDMHNAQKTVQHVIVISYDAFSQDNWQLASSLPNLSKLIENGAYSSSLKSVYPTLTYVVHATMMTGVYPNKHGVAHNNPLQPFVAEKNQEWNWYRRDIKVPTIYDLVENNGMTSVGLLWPVTGKAKIRYNLPEMAAINNENQALKVLKNGNPWFVIGLELKYGKLRNGIKQPNLDNFTTACAVHTIKNKKPNLLLMHLIELDDTKHKYGTKGSNVEDSIRRMDKRIGDIFESVEDAGLKDSTVFIVIGDHGQLDVKYKIHFNKIFKDIGLIYEEDGRLIWRAYLQSAGGSAYLHIRDDDKEAERIAVSIINKAIEENKIGIERLLYRDELDNLHIDSSVNYMVEAKVGYSFDDDLDGPLVEDLAEKNILNANHGYLPDKNNYRCNIVISGPIIKNNYELGDINMVDIAPTIAKILGLELKDSDGRVVDEIFI